METTSPEPLERFQDPTRLTGKDALRIRALLAKSGKAVCENCHDIWPIRECLCVFYKGQIFSSCCPKCRREKGLLVTADDTHVRVDVVDADRNGGSLIEVVPGQALDVLDKIGPKVEKTEL